MTTTTPRARSLRRRLGVAAAATLLAASAAGGTYAYFADQAEPLPGGARITAGTTSITMYGDKEVTLGLQGLYPGGQRSFYIPTTVSGRATYDIHLEATTVVNDPVARALTLRIFENANSHACDAPKDGGIVGPLLDFPDDVFARIAGTTSTGLCLVFMLDPVAAANLVGSETRFVLDVVATQADGRA
ncbi:hypothetical protein [Sanguibacter sp. HDW7]|uniref:hypothetical protein n=1 Tax=Sanguibacter sp. HDW7 TaxID=2714931 RepID=UPI0014094D33|nr:hypothetical protein [Sanguibacter sp. HDW7]QIK82186.1 hypothetical protein G7063_00035 [Sanguibacter sp. HDW7]